MNLPYDLSKTGRVAAVFLLVYCVAEVIFAWHSYLLFDFYGVAADGSLSADELDAQAAWIDTLALPVSGVFLIVLLGSYIASGMWIYRAASNAQAVKPDPDAIKPGWAVGWYFVPIANLWMPYKAMRQTWERLGRESWPSWAIVWWLAWLFGNSIATAGTRLNLNAQTLDEYRTAAVFDITSSVLSIPAAFLFRRLILEMTAMSANAQPIMTPDLEEGQL